MSKSALIKSSIAKKYWMAFTGLFLCLFLVGHLAGNLQLIFGTAQQFNEYALFMTTNPAIKILSYVTYFSILFHAVDGFLLTIQNRKARPVAYAMHKSSANSSFASRNMAVLGTLILVFIITHMTNFWAKMHFDKNMPLATKEIDNSGMKQYQLIGNKDSPMPVLQLQQNKALTDEYINEIKAQTGGQYDLEIKNVTKVYNKATNELIFEGYKDLYKLTIDFFKSKNKLFGVIPNEGLVFTMLYVISMLVLAFHLWHGFQSAFQSMGVNNKTWTPKIKLFGKLFAVIVPLLFAAVPLYIHFVMK